MKKINVKELWMKHWLNLIYYINHFIFKLKRFNIFRHPEYLTLN